MTAEDVMAWLEQDALERLKWMVLREFGILPGSKQAGELTDEDFVICGAHMVLDGRAHRSGDGIESGRNAGFDEARFAGFLEGEK